MNLLLTGKYFNERLDFLSWLRKNHTISQELDATVIFDLLDNNKNNYDAIIIDENLFNTCNQTLDFAWGLHLNYPEIPTILIISPRDSYEEIFDIYKKGVLFEIIERFQIDAKSKFSHFNSILFKVEQYLKRIEIINGKSDLVLSNFKKDVEKVKNEFENSNEKQNSYTIKYLFNCLKFERELFKKEREIFRSVFFRAADYRTDDLNDKIFDFEKHFLGLSNESKKFFDDVLAVLTSSDCLLIQGKLSSEISDIANFIYLFRNLHFEIPFIEIDCKQTLEENFLMEIFGCYKRSTNNRYFVSEGKEKIGSFEQANGGIVFLNNINDLSIRNQEALFSVLKNGHYTPIGGFSKEHRVEINFDLFVGATKSLHTLVNKGEFKWQLLNYIAQGSVLRIPDIIQKKDDFKFIFHNILINSGMNVLLDDSAIEFLAKQNWIEGTLSINRFVNTCFQKYSKSDIVVLNAFEIENVYNSFSRGFEKERDIEKISLYELYLNTKTISTVKKVLDFLESVAVDYFTDFKIIKTIDLSKLAYQDFHQHLEEKRSTKGRKRLKDCLITHRFRKYPNNKINQQRLAVKYLMNLSPEKWSLLRKVVLFIEILSEDENIFNIEKEQNYQPLNLKLTQRSNN